MSEINKNKKYNIKNFLIIFLIILFIFLIPTFTESKPEIKGISEEKQIGDQVELIQKEKGRLENLKKQLEIDLKIKELELEKEKIKNPLKPLKVEAKEARKESVDLEDRKAKINQYFAKYTPGTPLTAEMIITYADKYQIPDGFFLAVCHNESHCGTKGRAIPTKNPFNVGNITAGDNKATNCQKYSNCLGSFEEGVEAFARLISAKYFNENEKITLETWVNRDFTAVRGDVKGSRYMTDQGSLTKYKERIQVLQNLEINY